MSSSCRKLVAVVFAVEPRIAKCVAEKFISEDYIVALVFPRLSLHGPVEHSIVSTEEACVTITADYSSAESIQSAMHTAREKTGNNPEVVVYSIGLSMVGSSSTHSLLGLEKALNAEVNCALAASQEALPAMVAGGKGTVIFTRANMALKSNENFTKLISAKFALLSQTMSSKFAPQGIHCARVIMDSMVGEEKTIFEMTPLVEDMSLDPRKVAEQYWMLHSAHKHVHAYVEATPVYVGAKTESNTTY